jgi:ADP-ribose pyrophosphatase YjhB (NUDIX family)
MEENESKFLVKYDSSKYWKPSVTADIVLFVPIDEPIGEYKLLLIKRKNYPNKGWWALPGGFLNEGETLLEAAHRELDEETGIKEVFLEQLALYDNPNRDPRTRIISMAYLGVGEIDDGDIQASDDASEAGLFTVRYEYIDDIINFDFIGKSERLVGKVKICKNVDISQRYEILCSKGIAFDHIKIIANALEVLLNK